MRLKSWRHPLVLANCWREKETLLFLPPYINNGSVIREFACGVWVSSLEMFWCCTFYCAVETIWSCNSWVRKRQDCTLDMFQRDHRQRFDQKEWTAIQNCWVHKWQQMLSHSVSLVLFDFCSRISLIVHLSCCRPNLSPPTRKPPLTLQMEGAKETVRPWELRRTTGATNTKTGLGVTNSRGWRLRCSFLHPTGDLFS